MSRENVEIVRQLLPPPDANLVTDLLFRGDDAGWNAYASDVLSPWFTDDFVSVAHIGASNVSARGLQGWRDGWLDWLEPWETYRTEIERISDADDRVLVFSRDYGRRFGMADEVELKGSAVWTVRDRRISRAEFFTDRAKAVQAAGLTE